MKRLVLGFALSLLPATVLADSISETFVATTTGPVLGFGPGAVLGSFTLDLIPSDPNPDATVTLRIDDVVYHGTAFMNTFMLASAPTTLSLFAAMHFPTFTGDLFLNYSGTFSGFNCGEYGLSTGGGFCNYFPNSTEFQTGTSLHLRDNGGEWSDTSPEPGATYFLDATIRHIEDPPQVPEPSTAVLLATGLALVWKLRRRSHERLDNSSQN